MFGPQLAAASAGTGPSPAIRRYMDDKINSSEYVREVSEQTERELERELDRRDKEEPARS
jgi:hypothetical protein